MSRFKFLFYLTATDGPKEAVGATEGDLASVPEGESTNENRKYGVLCTNIYSMTLHSARNNKDEHCR